MLDSLGREAKVLRPPSGQRDAPLLGMGQSLALFLLSCATLLFEVNLTRLFSVAQFYHFAFLIVSLALLGFGASGSVLAMLPPPQDPIERRARAGRALAPLALATAISIVGAYLLINWLPFDSFSIAWDRRQVGVLALNLLGLATPFFCSGLAVGRLLSAAPQQAGQTYAINLAGSATGCLAALAAPQVVGGEGVVILSAWIAAGAALLATIGSRRAVATDAPGQPPWSGSARTAVFIRLISLILLLAGLGDLGLRVAGRPSVALFDLRLSPYKGLSYALQYPGAQVIGRAWNAFARVDVVRSAGVRSLPGLSYRFTETPPPQDGLLVDGDDLSPIIRPADGPQPYPAERLAFASHLPAAIAFILRPQATTLLLEPRGGLDVLTALALGARQATAVEANPLIVEAARAVYALPRVRTIIESDRSYLNRSRERFDVIVLSLASGYHPVRSGAYSLSEEYRYTVEAFAAALARLNPGGLFVVTRWLQLPPSEELRAFALAVTALERSGRDPATRLIALRGYNTATLLIAERPYTDEEMRTVRAFAEERAFDLIYAPGLTAVESNRFNVLPEPVYFEAFTSLLAAQPRAAWYAAYPYAVAPPTDDHPFFGHFFKWSQASQLIAELGRTWQPFGGAGYFALLVLLALASLGAGALILLPLVAAWARERRSGSGPPSPGVSRSLRLAALAYFGWIGLAFLFVEIPLIQRFILYLDQPAYAFTVVLCTLLFFSGLGSHCVGTTWLPQRLALAALVLLVLSLPWTLPLLFAATLGWPWAARAAMAALILAPVGFLMGVPFAAGVRRLEPVAAGLVPWVWGVNGAASVIASILAALFALSWGFRCVLLLGAACYAGAWWAWGKMTLR